MEVVRGMRFFDAPNCRSASAIFLMFRRLSTQMRLRHFTASSEILDLRATTYEQACQVESGQPSPAERTARKQESALLHAAITTLPERMREALRLRHVERLTTAASAARLGVSVRTVEHQLAAARRRCAGVLSALSASSEAALKTHRSRSRLGFQGGEVFKGFVAGRTAHRIRRPQADAEGRALRFAEKGAAEVGEQLHAGDAGRFAVGHARDR